MAEARSELKHLHATVNTERHKLRAELESVRDKHLADSQKWKEQSSLYERRLTEKVALVNELKSELQETSEREATAQAGLRDAESETKDDLRRLRAKVEELTAGQRVWLEKQTVYEQRLGKATKDLIEAQSALSDLEHKRKSADSSRTEVEVLKAKLVAAERQIIDKNRSFDKQMQIIKDESKQELEDTVREHDRDIKKRDLEQKVQNEAYKYKLQYLELSQKELQKERKRWQDKEREYEKSLVSLTAELRELKLEHQQAVDLHEAFRAHVEAKESARQMETSNWEIKRQALIAEHQLALKQSETGKNAKVAQLEREVQKIKSELDDCHEEIDRLTNALEAGTEPAHHSASEEANSSNVQ